MEAIRREFFSLARPNVVFKYHNQVPEMGGRRFNRVAAPVWLYMLYRNAVYNSYVQKPELAEDIKQHSQVYAPPGNRFDPSGLYDYCIGASLAGMKEWQDSAGVMKCYIAYQVNADQLRSIIGFVHFEQKADGVVYIAQAGTLRPGQSIGRQLMQLVLQHYEPGTRFIILTRIFNTEAITLYKTRLGFTPIDAAVVGEFIKDRPERYCGFAHTTTEAEIAAIKTELAQILESHEEKPDAVLIPHLTS